MKTTDEPRYSVLVEYVDENNADANFWVVPESQLPEVLLEAWDYDRTDRRKHLRIEVNLVVFK